MIICIAEKVQEFDHLVCPRTFCFSSFSVSTCWLAVPSSLKCSLTVHSPTLYPTTHTFIHSSIRTYIPWMLIEQLLYCISCCSNHCRYSSEQKRQTSLPSIYLMCFAVHVFFTIKKKSSLMNKIGQNVLFPAVSRLSCVLRKHLPPLIYFIGLMADCPSGCRSRTLAQVSLYPHRHGSLSFSLVYNTVSEFVKRKGSHVEPDIRWEATACQASCLHDSKHFVPIS